MGDVEAFANECKVDAAAAVASKAGDGDSGSSDRLVAAAVSMAGGEGVVEEGWEWEDVSMCSCSFSCSASAKEDDAWGGAGHDGAPRSWWLG